MQKADEERPSRRPASIGLKVSKDVRARVPALLRNHEQTHDDRNQADDGPVDGKSLSHSIVRNVFHTTKRSLD